MDDCNCLVTFLVFQGMVHGPPVLNAARSLHVNPILF